MIFFILNVKTKLRTFLIVLYIYIYNQNKNKRKNRLLIIYNIKKIYILNYINNL